MTVVPVLKRATWLAENEGPWLLRVYSDTAWWHRTRRDRNSYEYSLMLTTHAFAPKEIRSKSRV